jgi:hypothetical protein
LAVSAQNQKLNLQRSVNGWAIILGIIVMVQSNEQFGKLGIERRIVMIFALKDMEDPEVDVKSAIIMIEARGVHQDKFADVFKKMRFEHIILL